MIKKIAYPLITLLAMSSVASALQQQWDVRAGHATFADGTGIPTGGLTLEVGTFAAGFTPDLGNAADWSANFLQTGLENPSTGWNNLGNATYPNVGQSQPGETIVRPGGVTAEQGYIWGYSSLDVGSAPDWILITNSSWIFPAGTSGDPVLNAPIRWYTDDAGTTAIVGSINHAEATGLDRTLQTQAIPEPSTYALIFGLGILGFLGFRRVRK